MAQAKEVWEVLEPPEIPRIDLRCPKCGLQHSTAREIEDPPEAVVAIILCPECCGGDFGNTQYEDANGNEVLWQPDI